MTKIKKSLIAMLVVGAPAVAISTPAKASYSVLSGNMSGLNAHDTNNAGGEIHASSHIGQFLFADTTLNAAMGALNGQLGTITPGAPQSHHIFKGKVSAWSQINGTLGHTHPGPGAYTNKISSGTMDTHYAGWTGGMDTKLGAWVVGGMFSYGRTMLDLGARNSTSNANNVTLGGYAGRKWGNFGVNAGASYTFNMIDQARDVSISGYGSQHLTDSYNGGVVTAKVGVNYTFHPFQAARSEFFHNATVVPFLDAEYVNEHSDKNTERGGSLALHSSSEDKGMTFGAVGFSAGTSFKKFGVTWMPSASANYQHEFSNFATHNNERFVNQNTANALSGGQGWNITGNNVSTTVAYTSAGIGAKFNDHWSTNISYFGGYGNYNMWLGGTAGFQYIF